MLNGDSENQSPQKALNKKMLSFLEHISKDQLLLPSFQRQKAWTDSITIKFLQAVYEKNPLGILLLVRYSEKEHRNSQLKPRRFDGINEDEVIKTEAEINYLLLDGQQRLTALWKVFNDGYKDKLFCIQVTKNTSGEYCIDSDIDNKTIIVSRDRKNPRAKTFCENIKNNSVKIFPLQPGEKGLLPLCFFGCQGDWEKNLTKWLEDIPSADDEKNKLRILLENIKNRSDEANMAYFLLPAETSAEEAAGIFIDINTGSVSLTKYDIVVADINKETNKYIEEILVNKLIERVPDIEKIDKDVAGELAIKIACLLDDKTPSSTNYLKLNLNGSTYEKAIFNRQDDIIEGIAWAVERLFELKIYWKSQLPSDVPLRVLPALHLEYKKYVKGTKTTGMSTRKRKANEFINRYLWHAFLTDRYMTNGIDVELFADYKHLLNCFKKDLMNSKPSSKGEKFSYKSIMEADWPKKGGIKSRGILMACLQGGGKDPMSEESISKENAEEINFHHIFPKSKLNKIVSDKKSKEADNAYPDLALNCLFISGSTNVDFGNDLPGTYLKNLWKDGSNTKEKVKKTFETHLIDADLFEDLLKVKNETHGNDNEKLLKSYVSFIEKRAMLVEKRIDKLLNDEEL